MAARRQGTVASAYVVGTADTKGEELAYVRDLIEAAGVPTVLVDLGTRSQGLSVDVGPEEVAAHHPGGVPAVLVDDRGVAVTAMAEAFLRFVATRTDIGGMIGLGGSGGTALITPALRALPVGVPKVMVTTVPPGHIATYVGAADICVMYSLTDIAGLNPISRRVLGNAAHALAGMLAHPVPAARAARPAIALTMFGVTTPCVEQVSRALGADHDCLVFHATGIGGQSMEKLVDSGLVVGVIDTTTTEVCDHLLGGVLSAGADRLGAIARTSVPYVGSCGALDMVNFGAIDSVPERFRGRRLHVHNPQVTLMRTTVEENRRIGAWIGAKLNACEGEVRFLLPEGGVSMIDAPGQPFHDPAADRALFEALEATVEQTPRRRLIRSPHHINDPGFAAVLVASFREVMARS